MSFGPQSAMTRTQPARPGMGGGNSNWLQQLMPLLQAMQQQRMRQGGANRFMPQQGGLFSNPPPQMPPPQMPAPSMFQPVQQAPRTPFAPYVPPPPPQPTPIPGSMLTGDSLNEWARRTPGSPIYDQHAPTAGNAWYGGAGGDGL